MKTFTLAFLIGTTALSGFAQANEATEFIDALRSRYVDRDQLDQKALSEATIAGLLKALGPGAQLLTAEQATNALPVIESSRSLSEPLARAEIIEPSIGYVRLTDVVPATEAALDAELKKFADAKVTGYILDLRFADGTNYEAAAAVASRFVTGVPQLFAIKNSGKAVQTFSATRPAGVSNGPAAAPLMVLVNAQTRGAGETLAAALRAQERAIVIGGRTAGSALAWDDVKLADGRVLRLATTKITLPNSLEVFPNGVTPDVPVKIDAKIEREVVLNAATNLTLTASLQPAELRKSMREADLMRAFRGESLDTPTLSLGTNNPAPADTNLTVTTSGTNAAAATASSGNGNGNGNGTPGVRDVVLQRAVDILKGIRVLLTQR